MNMKTIKFAILILFILMLDRIPAGAGNSEFSVFVEGGKTYLNDNVLNQSLSNSGYERGNRYGFLVGLGTKWRYSRKLNIYLYLNAFKHNVWQVTSDEIEFFSQVEIFARSTVIGIDYQFEKFPLRLFRPGLGIGFGSLQLQSPPGPEQGGRIPFSFNHYQAIDSLLENPYFESKLSRRYGLFDVSIATNLQIVLAGKEKSGYLHNIGLGLKAGYIFTFISSDWSMGPLKVNNGPDIGLNYFYVKIQWIYGGRW